MFKTILTASILLFSCASIASDCDDFFPYRKEIAVEHSTTLCNSFFAVIYDETNRRPLLSSSLFQRHTSHTTRSNDFHADSRVKNPITPADYVGSGYDRGHLTPAADAANDEQMHDTFLMTNMAPQAPRFNRGPWKELEEYTRTLNAKWVVTGVIYDNKTFGEQNIAVPSKFWKAIILTDGTKKFYIGNNQNNGTPVEVGAEEFNEETGLNF